MTKNKSRFLVLSLLLFAAVTSACVQEVSPVADADTDNDGLPDSYELAHPELGLNPNHADFIFVPVLRPGMQQSDLTDTIAAMKKFYAGLSNRNPDGKTGINMVVQWGNTLGPEDATTPYPDVRARGLPVNLVGYGHGALIDPGTGGGGQTNGPDWCGVSNNWWAIVHELGHQFGLSHQPPGDGGGSPFYASLMNYDYSYSFDGDPNKVQYSPGTFSSMHLDEHNLDENVPFSLEQLHFLTVAPYFFSIRAVDATHSQIDYNRNGVFGETGIHADINDGYAVRLKNDVNFDKTASTGALATLGDRLVSVMTVPSGSIDWTTYSGTGLSASVPGGLKYQVYRNGTLNAAQWLAPVGVTGDPVAVEALDGLVVAYPTISGYTVELLQPGATDGLLTPVASVSDLASPGQQPSLVRVGPDRRFVLVWNPLNKQVLAHEVLESAPGTLALQPTTFIDHGILMSNTPVAADWNSLTQRVLLAATDSSNQLQLHDVAVGPTGWTTESTQAVGEWGGLTSRRAVVLFDGRPSAGATGQTVIYQLAYSDSNDLELMYAHRLIQSDGTGLRWHTRMLINEWFPSHSAPAATLYGDDIALGVRVNENFAGQENSYKVYLQASGMNDVMDADMDDIAEIAEHGLHDSLNSVRASLQQ